VTGSAGCQVGPITMNEDKVCNIAFVDVQAPSIVVSIPTQDQILKEPVEFTYTVNDNMPGVTSTLLLDGQPFGGGLLDPAVLSEGIHEIIVQAVDAAGNSSQFTVRFISVRCPVCVPPPQGSIPGNTWVLRPEPPPGVTTSQSCFAAQRSPSHSSFE
jgi:hypothetical protein